MRTRTGILSRVTCPVGEQGSEVGVHDVRRGRPAQLPQPGPDIASPVLSMHRETTGQHTPQPPERNGVVTRSARGPHAQHNNTVSRHTAW
jgi:hypothetical protein